jgi:hypothetical protein
MSAAQPPPPPPAPDLVTQLQEQARARRRQQACARPAANTPPLRSRAAGARVVHVLQLHRRRRRHGVARERRRRACRAAAAGRGAVARHAAAGAQRGAGAQAGARARVCGAHGSPSLTRPPCRRTAQLDELAQALPAPEAHSAQLARIAQLRADNEAVGSELEAELERAGACAAAAAVRLFRAPAARARVCSRGCVPHAEAALARLRQQFAAVSDAALDAAPASS